MTKDTSIIQRINGRRLALLIVMSFGLMIGGLSIATVAFEQARFPGSLFTAQLAFDADLIRTQYATLIANGTMSTYITAQILDYLFIIGLGAFGYFLHVAIARAHSEGSTWHKVARVAGLLVVTSASFDAIENIASFMMLADPTGFAPWLAPLYSSLATAKWSIAAIGTPLLVVELVALAVTKWRATRTTETAPALS